MKLSEKNLCNESYIEIEKPIAGKQPQHALALFKTTKKNLVEATRFGVGCKNAGRIPSLDCDANPL